MIVRPGLIELLHLALYTLFDLRPLLVQLPLQQFGTVLNQDVTTHQVELASVSHLDYPKALLDVRLVITPLLQTVLVFLRVFWLL
jgi:hypothetical protein